MTTSYSHLSLELARGRAAWTSFAKHVRDKISTDVAAAGGEFLGMFAPQLGFASNEMIVLLRWSAEGHDLPNMFARPEVVAIRSEKLDSTVRPRTDQRLRTGGIYVHRWFTVDANRTDDFVDLSNRAWDRFESSYDTEIFGMFVAEANAEDSQCGAARLLLLTWYRDHGVWEASREQAQDARSLFAQRHLLTRLTIGRSSVLVL